MVSLKRVIAHVWCKILLHRFLLRTSALVVDFCTFLVVVCKYFARMDGVLRGRNKWNKRDIGSYLVANIG